MKRSEPQWKRKAARAHCKARRDYIWDQLAGKKPLWKSFWGDINISIVREPVSAEARIFRIYKNR